MRCQEFREMTNSYISDELLVETNHEVLRHLENCADCRNELAAHRELRSRVRIAVKSAPEAQINPAFAFKLQAKLRETALQPGAWEKFKSGEFWNFKFLTTVAASLLVVSLFAALWLSRASSPSNEQIVAENDQSNQSIETPQPAESPIVRAVQAAWHELAETAIGDHKNCAVKFRLEEKPITLTEAAARFGRFNKDLDKTVIAALQKSPATKPDEIKLLSAHSCVFQNRRFAHLVLKYRNRVVSILVADTDLPDADGETIAVQTDGDRTRATSFKTAHHAVFVVSDLSEAENAAIARIISPSVRRHIERAEA